MRSALAAFLVLAVLPLGACGSGEEDEWAGPPRPGDGGSLDSLSADTRRMQRHFFVNATAGELDKQGRVVIPALLLEREGIGREVTVTGVGDHLEIWDRAKWRATQHEVEGSAEDVAERLANRD